MVYFVKIEPGFCQVCCQIVGDCDDGVQKHLLDEWTNRIGIQIWDTNG